MTWRDNLRAASSEDGFIIANGSGASLIPQNTNWHDNYMNSFTEDGIKIANLKDAVSQVETLPQEADTGSLYYLTTGENPGMYYYDGTEWVAVGVGGVSDFNDLTNRPQLNGTAMTGNTNITNFVGTDGTNAGAQGLVPAPATTDNGSLLKADGTWGSEVWFKNQYNFPGVKITKDSRAAGQGSITIGAEAMAQGDYSVALGNSAYTGEYANSAVAVGQGANAQRTYSTAVGTGATSYGGECTAIGASADSRGASTVAIGAYSRASSAGAISFAYCNDGGAQGVVNFGPFNSSYGYGNTNYRLITGVHDAQNAHDAVTLGQLNALITQLQSLGLNVSLQGASNAGQNSGSSEDPGTMEPDPGTVEQTVTCPFCGQQTPADSTVCQICGNDISGGAISDPDPGEEPGPEIPPEEPTEEPVEG